VFQISFPTSMNFQISFPHLVSIFLMRKGDLHGFLKLENRRHVGPTCQRLCQHTACPDWPSGAASPVSTHPSHVASPPMPHHPRPPSKQATVAPSPKARYQAIAVGESPLFLSPPKPTPALPRRRALCTSAPAPAQCGRGLASCASGLHSAARCCCAAGPRSPLLDWAAGRCGPLSCQVFFHF
jgi:hypothetical protein